MTGLTFSQPRTRAQSAELARATQACRDITRESSKTFYLGSRFFPPQQRKAVWAVYAACRQGDDLADGASADGGGEAGLDRWWARVQAAFAGHPGPAEVDRALAWAVAAYPVPLSAFEELYAGLRMDVQGHVYRDMDDLELYARRVAGVVGFMIAPICGYSGGEHTLAHALRLGQAMQLTNILRDVGEDWRLGRVYLPQSVLDGFGVTQATLAQGQVTPEYCALTRHLTALAREWYAQGRAGIPYLHGPARLAVACAARAYEGILDDLERHGCDNFARRAHVSTGRKLGMLPAAWWETRRGFAG